MAFRGEALASAARRACARRAPERRFLQGYRLVEGPPALADYLSLRLRAGLSPKTALQGEAALRGSWCAAHVHDARGATVGMGRVIGDGGWYFHIVDMAVLPEHQRRGIGDSILTTLIVRIGDLGHFQKEETGYQQIQGTKPQTLGYGLNDSPAGLAAWIVEKFRTWSDCDGDVAKRFTNDELLTNIVIYWVTQSITSSTRLYYETMHSGRFGPAGERVETPTGCAIFPKELYRAPRAWAERAFNVQHWTRMPRGGHFAALEEPSLLVDDVRSFFRTVRG
jgi:GNAT superfamily N-acetyltransferase